MTRALDAALNMPWAITEDYLRTIVSIASREDFIPEAVAAKTGDPLDGARRVTVRQGVAVIPVVGPIFRRANLFTKLSGGTSIEMLARDFNEALENDDVRAIVLDVDSPGGEANGVSELADMVFDARQQMPVVAFVGGNGASGAYWIASAAQEVVAADTAVLGSIGVRAAFVDVREAERQQGIRRFEFVSSQSPNKAVDPADSEGRAQIQRVIDSLADVFISSVAKNRGVSRATVLDQYGQGAVFVGEAAVDRGLADRIGTLEGVLKEVQSATEPASTPGISLQQETDMSDEPQDHGAEHAEDAPDLQPPGTAEELRDAFPQLVGEIEEAAAVQERERIQAIEELEAPGHEDFVAERKFDPEATADSVSREVLERQKQGRQDRLNARREDEEQMDAPGPAPSADVDGGEEGEKAAAFILTAGKKRRESA